MTVIFSSSIANSCVMHGTQDPSTMPADPHAIAKHVRKFQTRVVWSEISLFVEGGKLQLSAPLQRKGGKRRKKKTTNRSEEERNEAKK